jgi:putative transposase
MLTPATVHAGEADAALDARHGVMLAAFAATPERFINGEPKRIDLPTAVWINQPNLESVA